MTVLHILTPGLTSANGRAFLFPLLRHRRALAERGISLALFGPEDDPAAVCDCDHLILDSRTYSARWASDSAGLLDLIGGLAARVDKLLYFDTTDSSGWDHGRVLPLVHGYFKNQVLRDRGSYRQALYGYRLFTDYYHRHDGVVDDDAVRSEPVADPADLAKIQVGWNSALMDYGWPAPLRMAAYQRTRLDFLLRLPVRFHDPAGVRPQALSCRFGTRYSRATVAHHRQQVAGRLAGDRPGDRLPRRRYLAEMRTAKIAVSPFGFGEICYRDYEAFLSGAALLKPDMSHLETWPDLYRDGETMRSHAWDLSDLEIRIAELLDDDAGRVEIARRGQETYRRHLQGPDAAELFCRHLDGILAFEPASPREAREPAAG